MVNLFTHYKEREPEQTIEIIKNFFDKNDLTIKVTNLNKSEAETWFCHLDLFQKNVLIGSSNGKGITEKYALASGYAELYERFCNSFFTANPYWAKSLIDYNQQHNGYNFRKDEKTLTIEEQLEQVPAINNFLTTLTDCNTLRNTIINYITDNKIIGLPYKSIDDQNKIYLDPRISIRLTHSIGMAAGNTTTEALVQGISEIIENIAYLSIMENPSRRLHAIKLESINNSNLQKIIQNIQNCGYDLYLFDLSYNLQIPVMMSVIVDKKNGTTSMNFGSFPVFEIAAERVLTELYQGIQSFREKEFLIRTRVPYKLFDEPDYILRKNSNDIDGSIMPYYLLENITWEDTNNTEYFIDSNLTNEDYLNYLIELTKKLNLNLYYLDNSLMNDMCAISIIDINNLTQLNLKGYMLGIEPRLGESAINKLIEYSNIIFNNIYNNTYDSLSFLEFLNLSPILESYLGDNKLFIFLWNYFSITENSGDFYLLDQVLNYNGQISGIPVEIIDTIYQDAYRKYYLYAIYLGTKTYKNKEYDIIFNKHFNFNMTEEDKQNYFNKPYLLKKIYFDPISEYIHSDDYLTLIKMFANK